jgi:hypothetical protein
MMRSDSIADGILYFIVKLCVLAIVLIVWWIVHTRPAI